MLKNLLEEVQVLKAKYQQNATKESGLILHSQVQATSSCESVRKLKLKYKYFRQHTAPYGSLKPKNTPGRPRGDYHHQNRVEKKASNWRKVYNDL